jgi:hypothetical protein
MAVGVAEDILDPLDAEFLLPTGLSHRCNIELEAASVRLVRTRS